MSRPSSLIRRLLMSALPVAATTLVPVTAGPTVALADPMIGQRRPGCPANPQAMAAEAMVVSPGPLILVRLEQAGTTQVLGMTGDNSSTGTRTFMTTNEQALILRSFMLTGTRGPGNDLSVAEASQSAALVTAKRSGTAQRVMRYYSGDGLEQPI